MEPKGSLLGSQELSTCSWPDESCSNPPILFQTHFKIIILFMPRSHKPSVSFMFLHKNPAHTSPLHQQTYQNM